MRLLLNTAAMVASLLLAACHSVDRQTDRQPGNSRASQMTPKTFQALPSAPADYRIAYGTEPEQYGDLRLPAARGKHPVVVLIHGGCFKAEYATLRDLAPMADALKARGIATWNIEYRRIGNAGGGWPGTYLDVGQAVDKLRSIAADHPVDPSNVVVVGHSAGGHLAMWVAARTQLPRESPLFVDDPLSIKGVVNLAGYGDLEAFRQVEKAACGGTAVAETLLEGNPATVPDRYKQASAAAMLPLGKRQILVWGEQDSNTPLWLANRYIRDAKRAGDSAQLLVLPGLGHFEIADPGSSAWPVIVEAIDSLQRPNR